MEIRPPCVRTSVTGQPTYRMLHEQLVVSNKIKSVSGDLSSLCQDVCDGTTNVPNAARTACGEQ